MKKKMTLRNTIFITMISIITVIVSVFGLISGKQFEKMLTDRAINDYGETVNTMRQNVLTLRAYMEDFAKYLAIDETLKNSIEEYRELADGNTASSLAPFTMRWDNICSKLISTTSNVNNIDIYSGQTLVFSYRDKNAAGKENVIPMDIIEQATEQSPPIWTSLLTIEQTRVYRPQNEMGFAVVKSVRNNDGHLIGAIAIYVSESSFSELLSANSGVYQSSCYLVDSSDCVVSAKEDDYLYADITKVLELDKNEYEHCLAEGTYLKESHTAEPVLYISSAIEDTGLRLICEVSLEDLALQKRSLQTVLLVTEIMAVIFAILAARYVSDRITRPLGTLMQIIEKMKTDGGKTQLRFPANDSSEIGILGENFNNLMERLDESREQVYQEQRQRRHNEVRLLQMQILPHFLYNTLGVISSLIKLNMYQQAIDALQKLADFYRISLSNGKEIITISDEIRLLHNYIELQKLRYIEYIEYEIDVDPSLPDMQIPKLTLQPLVENVLHHALRPDGKKCSVYVRVRKEENPSCVVLSVRDNGVGIPPERLKQLRESLETGVSVTDSFGVLNVHQRLKLRYGETYHMEIESCEGEFTEFSIYLLNEKEGESSHV